mgnify:CR=1 FL=1|tara:strand:+ start:843 stop:1322 length:480 start_codon:yes stop_codon:yes gene_type:complete
MLTTINSELILETLNGALENHKAFNLPCDDVFEGYVLPLITLDVKSLSRHYHESFWGDDRDQGISPLLCVDIEFVINAADRLEHKEIIEVIAKAFEDQLGVRLFKCSLEYQTTTRLVRGRVITRQSHPRFKITASQDPRLLDIDSKAHYEQWKQEQDNV